MKIRSGFVSNSSSSSFIIVGKSARRWRHIDRCNHEDGDECDCVDFDVYDDSVMPIGYSKPDDAEFLFLKSSDEPEETIVGFGRYAAEYGWNNVCLSEIERWREKAEKYFGDLKDVKVWFGIEGSH